MSKEYEVIYEYDDNGHFFGTNIAQYCPISGELLMPPMATLLAPELKDGCLTVWTGENWVTIEEPGEEEVEECLQQS